MSESEMRRSLRCVGQQQVALQQVALINGQLNDDDDDDAAAATVAGELNQFAANKASGVSHAPPL